MVDGEGNLANKDKNFNDNSVEIIKNGLIVQVKWDVIQ